MTDQKPKALQLADIEAIGAGGVGPMQSGGIPPNWKLVPVEPTEDMCAAFAELFNGRFEGMLDDGDISNFHRAMLAAAPQLPVVEQSQGEQAPVAWMYAVDGEDEPRLHFYEPLAANNVSKITPLYTHPQPPRQPLTDEQRRQIWRDSPFRGNGGQIDWFIEGTRAAERAHGIGQEGDAA